MAMPERKGAGLRVLNLGMDTSKPTGKLMLTILGGIVQFEREMMLERQREGVAKAKAAGKYKGRKPTPDVIRQEVARLAGEDDEGCHCWLTKHLGKLPCTRFSQQPQSKNLDLCFSNIVLPLQTSSLSLLSKSAVVGSKSEV